MVNAVEDITIFNLRYDSDTRREVLVPTHISGVSFYHSVSVSATGNGYGGENRTEKFAYKVRIPISAEIEDNRQYISEPEYNALSDADAAGFWTIQKGCYLIQGALEEGENVKTIDELRALTESFITVMEYADNTRRGSQAVQHWRIGGY